MKMIAERGNCLTCNTPIREKPSMRALPNYSEVQVVWSNGSKMNVAVCQDCAKNATWATPEGQKSITEWHWNYWTKEGGKFNREIVVV